MHLSSAHPVSAHAGSMSFDGIDSHVQQFPAVLQSAADMHSATAAPEPVDDDVDDADVEPDADVDPLDDEDTVELVELPVDAVELVVAPPPPVPPPSSHAATDAEIEKPRTTQPRFEIAITPSTAAILAPAPLGVRSDL